MVDGGVAASLTKAYKLIGEVCGVKADTIQKLEQNIEEQIYTYNRAQHVIFPVFIERGTRGGEVKTSLNKPQFISEVTFEAASSLVRKAREGQVRRLDLVPYTEYVYACKHNLYDLKPEDALPRGLGPVESGVVAPYSC
jgi:hypothetical protein